MTALPIEAAHLHGFARLLRAAGFSIAPEQIIGFLHGVALLGPRSMDDIRSAALAALGPTPDRFADFDRLFRFWFSGDGQITAAGADEDETPAKDDGNQRDPADNQNVEQASGELASATDQLAARRLVNDNDRLAAFVSAMRDALPVRRSYRNERSRSQGGPDLRRMFRLAIASDGDVPLLPLRRRRDMQRRLLVMIDISGSMKQYTSGHMMLAHAIVQGAAGAEIFTIGTRLTRITRPLRIRQRDRALARVGELVEDWDGGTRIGPTLLTFLGIPRFAALARGAVIIIISDGLERGSHADMETALRRLSARAYRLSLCSPLVADPRFRPRTAALQAALPLLDDLVDGASLDSLTKFILTLARPAPSAIDIWRKVS